MAGWTVGAACRIRRDLGRARLVGLGLGLTLAPVNAAALASARPKAHGVAAAVVVVARMVGMVLGLALLTAVGLRRYYAAVAALADPTDPRARPVDAAVVQVRTVFAGGGLRGRGPRGRRGVATRWAGGVTAQRAVAAVPLTG